MIRLFEKISFTNLEPLFKNVLWLEKRAETPIDENAFNFYIYNHGDWRNILQQMWDNKLNIENIQAFIAGLDLTGYATQQWVLNQNYLTLHLDLTGYATETWVNSQGFLTLHQPLKTINSESLIGTGDIVVGGGGEPSEYIKSVSTSTNTCTFTKKDNSTVTFSVDFSGCVSPSSLNNYLPLAGGTMTTGNSGINMNSGNITGASKMEASSGFYETSDIRKKDIKGELSLLKAYELIEQCSTIVYSLKGENKEQIGLIAQEVEEFFPEIVSTGEDGFKSLDYSRLTVVLIRVIKDIVNRLNKLEN